MLPSTQEFEKQIGLKTWNSWKQISQFFFLLEIGAMDINESDDLVVYDQSGIFSSPRVYWTFKVFGHEKIRVLNGGFPKWLKEGKSRISKGEEKFKVRTK